LTAHGLSGTILHCRFGPVAQLGARVNRTDEVAGSNPARSTGGCVYNTLGAHSAAGSAPQWHCGGRGFDPHWVHQINNLISYVGRSTRLSVSESGISSASPVACPQNTKAELACPPEQGRHWWSTGAIHSNLQRETPVTATQAVV
jgi:hypothetical protein